jgi:uncharacterized protein YggU (UPF0235/DUF167 family)
MSSREYHMHDGKKGAAVAVRLVTRASKDEVSEILNDGTIKIRLTAGPSDDQVNQALIEFLAKVLETETKNIDIVARLAGRDKLVAILDLDAETVQQRLVRKLA